MHAGIRLDSGWSSVLHRASGIAGSLQKYCDQGRDKKDKAAPQKSDSGRCRFSAPGFPGAVERIPGRKDPGYENERQRQKQGKGIVFCIPVRLRGSVISPVQRVGYGADCVDRIADCKRSGCFVKDGTGKECRRKTP